MKSKNEKEFINSTSSTELEINGEKIIIGFQSKKTNQPINPIEAIEKEFFKKKQAIVKLKDKNKVMSFDDIESFLISQAMGPTKHEASFGVLKAFMSAYQRFKKWEKSQSDILKVLFIILAFTGQIFAQQLENGVYFTTKYSHGDVEDTNVFNEVIVDPFHTEIFIIDDLFKFCLEDREECLSVNLEYYGLHNGFETYLGDKFKMIINPHVKGLSILYDFNQETNVYTKTTELWNLKRY